MISPTRSLKISLEKIPIKIPIKTMYDNILTTDFKYFNLIDPLIVP